MRALLVFILFCGYALAARWYYVCEIRGLCGRAADKPEQTLILREGERLLLAENEPLVFDSAVVEPRLTAAHEVFFDSVAAYLQRFPVKRLRIMTYYRPGESGIKVGFYDNIGIARAVELRKELMKRGIDQDRVYLDAQRSAGSSVVYFIVLNAGPPREEVGSVNYRFQPVPEVFNSTFACVSRNGKTRGTPPSSGIN